MNKETCLRMDGRKLTKSFGNLSVSFELLRPIDRAMTLLKQTIRYGEQTAASGVIQETTIIWDETDTRELLRLFKAL